MFLKGSFNNEWNTSIILETRIEVTKLSFVVWVWLCKILKKRWEGTDINNHFILRWFYIVALLDTNAAKLNIFVITIKVPYN